MTDKEEKRQCDHCESKWRISYDPDECGVPEVCPFCGAEATPVDSDEESDYEANLKEEFGYDEDND